MRPYRYQIWNCQVSLPENSGKNTAQECKNSISGSHASPENVFAQASYNQSEILSFRVKQNSVIPRNYLVYVAQMWLWSWSLLLFCGLIIEWWGHASGQNVWRPMGRQALTSLSLKLDIYPLSPLKSMFRQALSVVYCFDLRDRRQKRSYCICRTLK